MLYIFVSCIVQDIFGHKQQTIYKSKVLGLSDWETQSWYKESHCHIEHLKPRVVSLMLVLPSQLRCSWFTYCLNRIFPHGGEDLPQQTYIRLLTV